MKTEKGVRFEGNFGGKVSSISDDGGEIEGYLAVFGNVDNAGDRFIRGAFSKTVQERIPAGKVPLMVKHWAHGGDSLDVIGTVVEGKEDDYGLKIRAKLSSIQMAQDVRTKIKEGHINGLSVGYEVLGFDLKNEQGKTICDLTEAKLLEGTVTTRPCNEEARIISAKSGNEILSRLDRLEAKVFEQAVTDTQDADGDTITEGADRIDIEKILAQNEFDLEVLKK